jgi:branched-chain amino acid transport system permease protein
MNSFETFFQYIVAGLTRGSIYAVVAIGFNIIYNTTGIINFAQGEFVILGAMVSITLSLFLPLWAAIAGGIVIASLYGALVEIVFVKYEKRFSPLRAGCIAAIVTIILVASSLFSFLPTGVDIAVAIAAAIPVSIGIEFVFKKFQKEQNILQLIIITIGVSILTREAMLHIWDEKVRALHYFTGNEVSSIAIGSVQFSPQILWVLGILGLVVLGLYLFFKYTLIGKAMRATSLDRKAAQLCGINTKFLITLSFVVSAAIGALAGAVTSPLTQTQYNMGANLAINGFSVVILGGLGNSFAAALAGLILGILESLSVAVFPNAFKDIVAIVILLVVLFIKPSGLFGKREETTLKEF